MGINAPRQVSTFGTVWEPMKASQTSDYSPSIVHVDMARVRERTRRRSEWTRGARCACCCESRPWQVDTVATATRAGGVTTRVQLALIETAGEWATLLALCVTPGIAIGPPMSWLPRTAMSAGDAAAWGGFAGFMLALILIAVLPQGFVQ